MITELRCPNCNAPVDAALGAKQVCRYCGASLMLGTAEKTSDHSRTETQFVVVARITPTNAERVAKVLSGLCAMSSTDVESALRGERCEISAGTDRGRAGVFASALADAGADAAVVSREVAVSTVAVILEEVGANRTSVVTAIVNHVDRTIIPLARAIKLVDHAPCTVVERIDEPDGRALLAALEKAGAKASLR